MTQPPKDLLSYLDARLGGHAGRGPEYQFHCPACIDRVGDESSKRKLGINLKKQVGGCFRCGFAFRSFEQLFRYLNGGAVKLDELALLRNEVSLPTATLKAEVRRKFVKTTQVEVEKKPHPLPAEYVELSRVSGAVRRLAPFSRAFEYLASRGVSEDKACEYRIGYCPKGEYEGYLVFPVVQEGQQVYFTTRYCGAHRMKSKNPLNAEGYHQRSSCLLNYDRCVGQPVVALAEGPFSALAFPFGMAMMGKFLSDDQVRLIAKLVPKGLQELMLALDPGAGIESDKAYSTLASVVPRVSVVPLVGGDPDDLKDAIPNLIEQRREPTTLDRVRQRLNG